MSTNQAFLSLKKLTSKKISRKLKIVVESFISRIKNKYFKKLNK